MRKAEIKIFDHTAGWLIQDEKGDHFMYYADYPKSEDTIAVSLTLPLQSESYTSKVLFPFFDGLIPEDESELPAF